MNKYLVIIFAVTILLLTSCRQALQPSDEMLHGTNDGSGASNSESNYFDQPTQDVTDGTDFSITISSEPATDTLVAPTLSSEFSTGGSESLDSPWMKYEYNHEYNGDNIFNLLYFLYHEGQKPFEYLTIPIDVSQLKDGYVYRYNTDTKETEEIIGPALIYYRTSEHLYYVPQSDNMAICRKNLQTGAIERIVDLRAFLGKERVINHIEFFGSNAEEGMILIIVDRCEVFMYELESKTLTSLMTQKYVDRVMFITPGFWGTREDDGFKLQWAGMTEKDTRLWDYMYYLETGKNEIWGVTEDPS